MKKTLRLEVRQIKKRKSENIQGAKISVTFDLKKPFEEKEMDDMMTSMKMALQTMNSAMKPTNLKLILTHPKVKVTKKKSSSPMHS